MVSGCAGFSGVLVRVFLNIVSSCCNCCIVLSASGGSIWFSSVLNSADDKSFAVAIIVASREAQGILKLWGSHLLVCTMRSAPVCLMYTR